MATESMNILVTFKNAAKAGVKSLNRDLKRVDATVGKTTKGLKSFHGQLLAIGAVFAGGAFFGNAISVFAKFDDNMRAAGAVTSATADELERMTDIAKEMGRETRFTASQSAEALRFLGMAGFEASEAIAALPGTLDLAAAGALDLGTAADIATNVLTGFGIEVEQLGRVNDVLVKTFTSANVNLIEIGESFKMVGPIAKGVGGNFEDLVGSIGALGNAGIKGTMAGVALKNAIDALLAPTGKEAALLKKLEARMGGVALKVRDSEGDFIGFVEVIKQLEAAGLRGDEALQAFGLRAGPAMVALMNQGSEAIAEMKDGLDDAGGTAKRIAAEMEAGIGGELRKTISVLESLKITFGEAFGPEVTVILEAFRGYLLDTIQIIEQWKEDGTLVGIGQTIVDIFTVVNAVIEKTVDVLQSFTALAIASAAAITGDFDLAREAMKGWVKETNDIFAQSEKWDGVVSKPITDEMNATRAALEEAANPSGPIGKGTQKVSDTLAKKMIPTATLEAELNAALIKLNAILEKEAAELDANYDQGIIKLTEYYDTRINLAEQAYEAERKILQNKLDDETDVDKKLILNAKLFELQTKHEADIIGLNAERVDAQVKLDEDLLKSKEQIDRKRIKAEQAVKDQEARIRDDGTTTLDTKFAGELSALQNKQNNELQSIRDYHAAILENLKDTKAAEVEIERAAEEQKAAIREQTALQQQEQEQLAADQALRLQEYRIDNLKSIAGGAAQAFQALYEMMGSESKELFMLAKAAAIAEATMNVAQGITKAMAQGGIFGIAQGVVIAAAGAAQIATIASQGFAGGGEIGGKSPNKRADDKTIRVTSGEYVHQVDAVNHYGVGFMNAVNERRLKFAYGGFVHNQRSNKVDSFANGGAVTGGGGGVPAGPGNDMAFNIINVTDPRTLDQYLATTQGQDAVLNVIGARPEAAQRMLKGNG